MGINKINSGRSGVPYYIWAILLVFGALVFSCTNQAQEAIATKAASSAVSPDVEAISLPEVFSHVALVQAEIELIRFEMGKPENKQPEIFVKGAAPREAFFQALTLIRKTNRFSFEQRRESGSIPETPKEPIAAANVYALIDTALERIRLMKSALGIEERVETIPPDPSKTADDVYSAIVEANRQLNLMIDHQFTPSDVFQHVTLAVSLTSHLLAQFPGTVRTPPPAPEFQRGKRPVDVYRRLIGCYRIIRNIAVLSGLEMLALETSETHFEQISPSDVYDIAALVVSELSYIHAQLEDARPHREVYYPGRKFPSHVFQRVGILEKQLIELEQRVKENPAWLQKS